MNPYALERLFDRLGQPAWFWPLVMFVILVALPLLASAIENTEVA